MLNHNENWAIGDTAQRDMALKRAADAATEQANETKADLIKLAQHLSETGSGLVVKNSANRAAWIPSMCMNCVGSR